MQYGLLGHWVVVNQAFSEAKSLSLLFTCAAASASASASASATAESTGRKLLMTHLNA